MGCWCKWLYMRYLLLGSITSLVNKLDVFFFPRTRRYGKGRPLGETAPESKKTTNQRAMGKKKIRTTTKNTAPCVVITAFTTAGNSRNRREPWGGPLLLRVFLSTDVLFWRTYWAGCSSSGQRTLFSLSVHDFTGWSWMKGGCFRRKCRTTPFFIISFVTVVAAPETNKNKKSEWCNTLTPHNKLGH